MKKHFSKIVGLSLGIAMAIGVGVGVGVSDNNRSASRIEAATTNQETFNCSTQGWANQSVHDSFSGANFSVSIDKGSNSNTPKYYTNGTNLRIYGGGTITFSSTNNALNLASISFGNPDGNSISANVGTWSSPTWTGNASSVVFSVSGTSGNFRFVTVTVDYASASGPVKEDVELACNDLELDVSDSPVALSITATSGGNTVTGLSYTYSVANTSVANVSNSGVVTPVAIGETELTINFAGDDDYNAASKIISVVVSDRTLSVSNLTFAAACGGSGEADDGSEWTVTSDGTESNFDNDSGIHYGTNKAEVTYLQLSTSDLKGNIRQVAVRARDAQAAATISVTVGTSSFTCLGSTTATNSNADYVFTGNARGEVVVRVDRGSSMTKALYVKSIVVTYAKINLSSIALSGTYPTTFNQGDEFSHTGMIVTASYSDSSTEDVTSAATWTGYNMAVAGNQTVTVGYKGKTATYGITIIEEVMYTITGSISNGSLSSTTSIQQNGALNITINADSRYSRPTSLSVTMGGSAYNGFTYNSGTGAFSIASVTGNVVIAGECQKAHGYWADNPYTVAEARNAIDAGNGTSGVYATGIVSQIVTPLTSGAITYNISSDGSVMSDQLQAYKGKNYDGENFANDSDIKVGATVVIYGNLKKFSSTYEFDSNNQLALYTAPTDQDILDIYLNTASSITTLNGTEHRSSTVVPETITFSELGLTNGEQYLDPFDGGNFTITFAGGTNDGKYYTTGAGMRTYGGGSFTIESSEDISKIVLTWDSPADNQPASNDIVDVGTYDKDTFTWTGNENSITFSRPSGSGHWRLKAVEVTFGAFQSVDNVFVEFGAKIPVASWNAINENNNLEITNYGVMLFRTRKALSSDTPVQDAIDNGKTPTIISRGSGIAPSDPEDGYYSFVATVNVSKESNYDIMFCAAPFIEVNGTVYILKEVQYSVNTLAQYYIDNSVPTNLSGDALLALAA